MPAETINGYDYIGVLEIPALNLTLPIMADWDYDRLKIAPCRQFGSVETNDLVIAGHNYKTHFGYLDQLQVGTRELYRCERKGYGIPCGADQHFAAR